MSHFISSCLFQSLKYGQIVVQPIRLKDEGNYIRTYSTANQVVAKLMVAKMPRSAHANHSKPFKVEVGSALCDC